MKHNVQQNVEYVHTEWFYLKENQMRGRYLQDLLGSTGTVLVGGLVLVGLVSANKLGGAVLAVGTVLLRLGLGLTLGILALLVARLVVLARDVFCGAGALFHGGLVLVSGGKGLCRCIVLGRRWQVEEKKEGRGAG
jgi:hypothetical protein